MAFGHSDAIKSIGNSTTTARDLVCDDDVKLTFYQLAESVAARLREQGLAGRTLQIWIRDNTLASIDRQVKLPQPSQLAGELGQAALALFQRQYRWGVNKPVRALGLSVSDLTPIDADTQTSLLPEDRRHTRLASLEHTMDTLRARYGQDAVQRGMMLTDPKLCGLDIEGENRASETRYQG